MNEFMYQVPGNYYVSGDGNNAAPGVISPQQSGSVRQDMGQPPVYMAVYPSPQNQPVQPVQQGQQAPSGYYQVQQAPQYVQQYPQYPNTQPNQMQSNRMQPVQMQPVQMQAPQSPVYMAAMPQPQGQHPAEAQMISSQPEHVPNEDSDVHQQDADEHQQKQEPKFDQHMYGKFMGILNDMADGKAPEMSDVMEVMGGVDAQFWKGSVMGAVAAFAMTNETVKHFAVSGMAKMMNMFGK